MFMLSEEQSTRPCQDTKYFQPLEFGRLVRQDVHHFGQEICQQLLKGLPLKFCTECAKHQVQPYRVTSVAGDSYPAFHYPYYHMP